jgi:2'-5' RNA ligase
MQTTRRQLTLFPLDNVIELEKIRQQYNPVQFALIAAHITLCREDELTALDKVMHNCRQLRWIHPLCVQLGRPERFEEGRGVLLPGGISNDDFQLLRKQVLSGIIDQPRFHQPHLTLLHPRNSRCTDAIFETISRQALPGELYFDEVCLIEQKNGAPWRLLEKVPFIKQ